MDETRPILNEEVQEEIQGTVQEETVEETTEAAVASAEEAQPAETPASETPDEEAPVEKTTAEAVPAEEMPAEETPTEEAPAEKVTEEEPKEDAPKESKVEESSLAESSTEETPAEELPAEPEYTTKEEVIARLKAIADNEEQIDRQHLEVLKQVYYRIHNAEVLAAREAFVEAGGVAEEFTPTVDPTEEEFKAEMNRVKEMRAKAAEQVGQEKEANLKRKLEIIDRVKEMTVDADVADKSYKEFKELQAEWKTIGEVPEGKATEIWKSYQMEVEKFYDLLRLNYEFRNYDFKKNLEIKTAICEAAERLADVEDPVSAFHQLQQLHQQFRETGPVAKDLREEVWTRFKAASTVVNKRHQEHFETLKAQEEENLAKKTALCEKMETLDLEKLKTFGDWDKKTKEVLDLQAEWKTIGFTPRKVNAKIFERFRTACDNFFQKKSEYFKQLRETWAANLAEKTKLCEEAEALKDSTDWTATTNKMIELQKQWKTIGPTAHKVSEAVWKRFNDACNAFFNAKNAVLGNQREEENANLEKKNAIIAELEKILAEGAENAQEKVHELTAQWGEIGHVPFRKKDAIYKKYREALDRLRTEFHINAGRRNVENFRNRMAEKGGNQLERELSRLKTTYENKVDEIKNYETNLSFFSSKSKTGNALVDDIQRKIGRLKEDLKIIQEKIAAVKEQIKNGGKPKEEPATAAEAPEEPEAPTAEAAEEATVEVAAEPEVTKEEAAE